MSALVFEDDLYNPPHPYFGLRSKVSLPSGTDLVIVFTDGRERHSVRAFTDRFFDLVVQEMRYGKYHDGYI